MDEKKLKQYAALCNASLDANNLLIACKLEYADCLQKTVDASDEKISLEGYQNLPSEEQEKLFTKQSEKTARVKILHDLCDMLHHLHDKYERRAKEAGKQVLDFEKRNKKDLYDTEDSEEEQMKSKEEPK